MSFNRSNHNSSPLTSLGEKQKFCECVSRHSQRFQQHCYLFIFHNFSSALSTSVYPSHTMEFQDWRHKILTPSSASLIFFSLFLFHLRLFFSVVLSRCRRDDIKHFPASYFPITTCARPQCMHRNNLQSQPDRSNLSHPLHLPLPQALPWKGSKSVLQQEKKIKCLSCSARITYNSTIKKRWQNSAENLETIIQQFCVVVVCAAAAASKGGKMKKKGRN